MTISDIIRSQSRRVLAATTTRPGPKPPRDRCATCNAPIGAGRAGRRCAGCRIEG